MTMEDPRSSFVDENRGTNKFPVGMRVLAVDDDPICLLVLENLLRKCQYHVTTTKQAIKALQMLRENTNNFDLVISDVNMPDMDGFKLLEQVGLEMDLPVIMLSAHSDTNLVMKGVTHGAVDYLLKPVRIEELKNIWQHVIRRKKVDSRDQNKSPSQEKAQCATGDRARGTTIANSVDQTGKSNKRQKDQNEDEDEDPGESGPESDDPSTQKKPRVVWSVDLHKKFVAAVKQLGLEKAVPKKILDLMKVEGLTRENVASHLQKYRLYLKRIHTEATHQAHMITALGGKDSLFVRMAPLDGFGDFRGLSGTGRLPSTFPSYTSGAIFGRLNSPAGLRLHGIASSGVIQPGQSQSLSSSMNTLGKNHPAMLHTEQGSILFQGIPTSLELNQLQQSNCTPSIRQLNPVDDSNSFTVPAHFPDNIVTVSCSSDSLPIVSSNALMFQGNPEQGPYGNQDLSGSSSLFDNTRCNETWQGAAQLSKFPSNSSTNGINIPSSSHHIVKSPIDFSSTNEVSIPLVDDCGAVQCQEGFIGNGIQSSSCLPKQRWEDRERDHQKLDLPFNTLNSLVSSAGVTMSSTREDLQQNYAFCSKRIDDSPYGQLNGVAPSIQIADMGKFSMGIKSKHSEPYILDQTKLRHVQDNFGSLDDIMSAMVKREQNRTTLTSDELGLDAYPIGSCI